MPHGRQQDRPPDKRTSAEHNTNTEVPFRQRCQRAAPSFVSTKNVTGWRLLQRRTNALPPPATVLCGPHTPSCSTFGAEKQTSVRRAPSNLQQQRLKSTGSSTTCYPACVLTFVLVSELKTLRGYILSSISVKPPSPRAGGGTQVGMPTFFPPAPTPSPALAMTAAVGCCGWWFFET